MSRHFDGVDDRISVADSAELDITSAITVSAWVNPDTLPGNNLTYRLVAKWDGADTWILELKDVSGSDEWTWWVDTTTVEKVVTTTDVVANKWTFVTGTYDGANSRIHTNGVERNSLSKTGSISTNNHVIYFGTREDALGQFLDGKLAYVQIHDRKLSDDEIRQTMYYPGSISRGMVGFWPLIGSAVEGDYSGNNNIGTVTGPIISNDNPPINNMWYPRKPIYEYTDLGIQGLKITTSKMSLKKDSKLTLIGTT